MQFLIKEHVKTKAWEKPDSNVEIVIEGEGVHLSSSEENGQIE